VFINNMKFLKVSHLKSFTTNSDFLNRFPKNVFKYFFLFQSAIVITIKVIYM